jgi:tetratricopeptide (TPR) repeat protein
MPITARMATAAFLLAFAAVPALADDRSTCEQASGDSAIEACTRAIGSGQYSGLDLAKLHTNRGVERKARGDFDDAIADYDAAIAINPNDQFAFNNRANTWRDKGDIERALADYVAALRIDPDYTVVYYTRGMVYERLGDNERARADYQAALARPPKYPNGPGAQQRARQRLMALPPPRNEQAPQGPR